MDVFMERANACVTACVGITDPAAAIEAAKKAIASASAELLAELENDPEASTIRAALVDLNAAATLFGMEAEELPRDPDECCESGYHYPTTIDGDTSREWITRCDACDVFESDEEAAKYAANALGMRAEEHDKGWALVQGGVVDTCNAPTCDPKGGAALEAGDSCRSCGAKG